MVSSLRNEFNNTETGKLVEVNRQATKRIPRIEREPVYSSQHSYLFSIFYELHAARSHNGFSYNPISYAELDAYQRLTARDLSSWDVRMLKQIDHIFLAALSKAEKVKSKAASNK